MRMSEATQDRHLRQGVRGDWCWGGEGLPQSQPWKLSLAFQLAFGWGCFLVLVIMPTRSQAQSVMRRLKGRGGHSQGSG